MMITFEKIEEKDYNDLTAIMKAAFDDDTQLHTSLKEDGPCGYDDGSLIRKLNTNPNNLSEKIIYEGQIVGAYTISIKGTEYTLEMLFIDPNQKGKRIGQRTWAYIEKTYNKATIWYVETPDYSIRNHYFYSKKCGFQKVGENQYEDGAKSFIFFKRVKKFLIASEKMQNVCKVLMNF